VTGWWRRTYGAHPLHLLSLLACFALAGYAALQASRGPLPLRMAVWFIGAVIAHDLVLFPLYALADRSLTRLLPHRRPVLGAGGVNYVRVPALLSGLLLLVFFPLILRRSEPAYGAASGLNEAPYLARWLLLSGAGFAVSAVLFAVRAGRSRRAGDEPARGEPEPAGRSRAVGSRSEPAVRYVPAGPRPRPEWPERDRDG